MSHDQPTWFSRIFVAMMLFCGLVWVWTVAFIMGWPWDKTNVWKPEYRLVAVCQNKEACGVAYGDLAAAKAKGGYSTLVPAEPAGDIEEEKNWLKWKVDNGIIEVKASSWHFQTTIRYKVVDEAPVLLQVQDVPAKAFYYGVAAAVVTMIGLYLRKLRG